MHRWKKFLHYILTVFLFLLKATTLNAAADLVGTVIDDTTGLPIEGALVVAIRGNNIIATDSTAADGTYEILDIQPSNYTVVASKSGYQTDAIGIKLDNNQTTTLNFSLIPSGGGTIAGTVSDSSSTISGATVEIFDGPILIQTTTTDGSGNYSVPDFSPGEYIVLASATSHETEAKGATVTAGDITTVDFILAENPGTISGTVTITGTITPIENATVAVFDGPTLIDTTKTNASGTYSIPGLSPGAYTVVCHADDFQAIAVGATVTAFPPAITVDFALTPNPGTVAGTVTNAQTSAPLVGATIEIFDNTTLIDTVLTDPLGNYEIGGLAPGSYTIVCQADTFQTEATGAQITADTTTTVNFALSPNPGTISGTVKEEAAPNDPIAGALVEVFKETTLIAFTLTGTDGAYTIPNLEPASYTVVCQAAGFETAIQGATVTAGNTTTVNFLLEASPGTISGTVTEQAPPNDPIAGATISVFDGPTLIDTATTDASGEYTIAGLAPGNYIVVCQADDFQSEATGATVSSSPPATTVDFALTPNPGTVAGTVTNAQTGAPLAGATIEVFDHSTLIDTVLTDPSGNYEIGGLAPGSYTVVCQADTFQTEATGALITADTTTTVNFALTPNPGTIAGTVKEEAAPNDPIAGALVEVFQETTLIAFTLTDSTGAYSIPGLPPGSYTVVCQADSFETAFQTATVTAGNTTTANFLLEDTPGTISGTVKEQTAPNDPIDGALIAIIQNQTLVDFTRTGTDGAYTIANLAPGNYTVVALARGFQNDTSPATVTAGTTTTVNFLLEANPGTISGTLTDRCTSSPVPGAIITALQGSIPITSTVSDPSGNYSLPDLAPGSYTVEVVADDFVSTSSTTTVSANTVTTLNFILTPIPSPPRNLSGKVITNKFLTQRDRIHKITWAASASSCITEYRIYRNGALIKTVSAGSALEYLDHNRSRKQADTYTVTALNSFNQESAGVTITLR